MTLTDPNFLIDHPISQLSKFSRNAQGAYDVSERRACRAAGFGRVSHRYRQRRDPQTEQRIRIKDLAAARVQRL